MFIIVNSSFWVLVLGFIYYQKKLMVFLEPIFYIGLFTILFFSGVPDIGAEGVGVALLTTSIMILVGYKTGLKKIKLTPINNDFFNTNENIESLFLIGCILFSAVLFFYCFNENLEDFVFQTRFFSKPIKNEGNSFLWAFRLLPMWGIIFGRICLNRQSDNIRLKVLWYLLFVLVLVSACFSGTRGDFLNLFLSILIVDVWQTAKTGVHWVKKRRKFYILISFLAFFLILFMTFFRFQTFGSFGDVIDAISERVSNFSSDKITKDRSITENQDIAYIIDQYLNSPDYFYGIYAQLVNPIPRVLWSDKPMTFGQRLGLEQTGVDVVKLSWSMSAGIAGESIFNAGYLGLIIFPFLFGVFFRKLKRTIFESKNILYLTSAILFLSHSYLIIRGEWQVGLNEPLYSCVLGILLFKTIQLLTPVLFPGNIKQIR